MATPNASATSQKFEAWHLRLEETRARYHQATEHYRNLLQQQPDGIPHDANDNLALARQAESQALADYSSVLRTFTELTVNGNISAHQMAAGSSGV